MINNWVSYTVGWVESSNDTYENIIHLSQAEYDALETKDPDTLYSTPDSVESTVYKTIIITLTSDWWDDSEQTVSAVWVTISNTVIVSPDPDSFTDYTTSGIYCSAQSNNSLVFTCSSVPSNDITVNVVILF